MSTPWNNSDGLPKCLARVMRGVAWPNFSGLMSYNPQICEPFESPSRPSVGAVARFLIEMTDVTEVFC